MSGTMKRRQGGHEIPLTGAKEVGDAIREEVMSGMDATRKQRENDLLKRIRGKDAEKAAARIAEISKRRQE